MYKLKKEITIECAHSLKDSDSLVTKKCLNLHGHSYEVIIMIQTNTLKNGMIIDFGILKEIVYELDHKNLNDFIENPTAENMSKYLYDKIADRLSLMYELYGLEVEVYETKGSSASYTL